jgi:hypothetical protein
MNEDNDFPSEKLRNTIDLNFETDYQLRTKQALRFQDQRLYPC